MGACARSWGKEGLDHCHACFQATHVLPAASYDQAVELPAVELFGLCSEVTRSSELRCLGTGDQKEDKFLSPPGSAGTRLIEVMKAF